MTELNLIKIAEQGVIEKAKAWAKQFATCADVTAPRSYTALENLLAAVTLLESREASEPPTVSQFCPDLCGTQTGDANQATEPLLTPNEADLVIGAIPLQALPTEPQT